MKLFEILILLGLFAGAGLLAYVLYWKKDEGPSACIGCGACIGTGKCVMRRREAEKKQKKSQKSR